MFCSSAEVAAIQWADKHLNFTAIWSGFDARLSAAFSLNYGYLSQSGNIHIVSALKPGDRYVLFSETERLRGLRMGRAMPSVLDWNRVYDNGEVYLYHRRPRTPYQR